MKIKTFISSSVNELDKIVNSWLEKNSSKIRLHDMKVQSTSGKLVYVLIFEHYSVEEIED